MFGIRQKGINMGSKNPPTWKRKDVKYVHENISYLSA
jgi:hypothetical protein